MQCGSININIINALKAQSVQNYRVLCRLKHIYRVLCRLKHIFKRLPIIRITIACCGSMDATEVCTALASLPRFYWWQKDHGSWDRPGPGLDYNNIEKHLCWARCGKHLPVGKPICSSRLIRLTYLLLKWPSSFKKNWVIAWRVVD